ncbi:cellulose binding domain-containing protein [Actinomadura madurae]|uniref:cellulose binding domain-containing protein n=1 Tax=Actinomadura madurae TaxID=1993 RepID=UPI0020D25C51|nr:cellulose binding domain-containing protein [Actinomadura madurae]
MAPVHAAAAACKVVYKTNDWGGGFTASIDITNQGDALDGWKLTYPLLGEPEARRRLVGQVVPVGAAGRR